jgi:hypothetical protein
MGRTSVRFKKNRKSSATKKSRWRRADTASKQWRYHTEQSSAPQSTDDVIPSAVKLGPTQARTAHFASPCVACRELLKSRVAITALASSRDSSAAFLPLANTSVS